MVSSIFTFFYGLLAKLRGRIRYYKEVKNVDSLKVEFGNRKGMRVVIKVHVHSYYITYQRFRFMNRKVVSYEVHGILPIGVNELVRNEYEKPINIPRLLPWFVNERKQQEAVVHAFLDAKNDAVERLKK